MKISLNKLNRWTWDLVKLGVGVVILFTILLFFYGMLISIF
jgi:hypothetical protein